MRFGLRLGPFWVSTSTRRRRNRSKSFQGVIRDENGREHHCHHNHRTPEAAQECAQRENRRADEAARSARMRRVSSMSAEEYRREVEADPVYRDWLRRREAEVEAEIQRLKDQA
jgi:hypothetical protein